MMSTVMNNEICFVVNLSVFCVVEMLVARELKREDYFQGGQNAHPNHQSILNHNHNILYTGIVDNSRNHRWLQP